MTSRAIPAAPSILVVDDDDAVRMLLTRVLETDGHSVVQASSAEGALAVLESDQVVDLVVSDVVMPGKSGIEFRREVAERRPGLPVILVSGYSPEAPAEFAARAADTRYMAKPFAVDSLLELVKATLADQPGAADQPGV